MMLPSGNDAAICLAEALGGTFQPDPDHPSDSSSFEKDGPIARFVAEMNRLVKKVGITRDSPPSTYFMSPHGMGHERNLSCALDIAHFSREAMKIRLFKKIVKSTKYTAEANKNVTPPPHPFLKPLFFLSSFLLFPPLLPASRHFPTILLPSHHRLSSPPPLRVLPSFPPTSPSPPSSSPATLCILTATSTHSRAQHGRENSKAWLNTNTLLRAGLTDVYDGVKTGWIPNVHNCKEWGCLVTRVRSRYSQPVPAGDSENPATAKSLMVVVLGCKSQDKRFSDTAALVAWAWRVLEQQIKVVAGTPVNAPPKKRGICPFLHLFASRTPF